MQHTVEDRGRLWTIYLAVGLDALAIPFQSSPSVGKAV